MFFILIGLINISSNRDCNKKHGDYYYVADIKIRRYFYSKIRIYDFRYIFIFQSSKILNTSRITIDLFITHFRSHGHIYQTQDIRV